MRMLRTLFGCLLAAALFAVLAPPGAQADAQEECVFGPYAREIAKGVYVQEVKLYCREVEKKPADRIAEARELLALCREMGGSPRACNDIVFRSEDPALEPLVKALQSSSAR